MAMFACRGGALNARQGSVIMIVGLSSCMRVSTNPGEPSRCCNVPVALYRVTVFHDSPGRLIPRSVLPGYLNSLQTSSSRSY